MKLLVFRQTVCCILLAKIENLHYASDVFYDQLK